LPQKGRRTLIQESTTYHWLASSDDEGTWLTIEQAQQPELKVIVLVEHVNSTGGTNGGSNRQPAIVSPALVKRTIHYALEHDWGNSLHTVLQLSYADGVFVERMPL
jgi:hypothetical protein